MDAHIGTSDGFSFRLPPIELIAVWVDINLGIPAPEIISVSAIIGYVWFWIVWKVLTNKGM